MTCQIRKWQCDADYDKVHTLNGNENYAEVRTANGGVKEMFRCWSIAWAFLRSVSRSLLCGSAWKRYQLASNYPHFPHFPFIAYKSKRFLWFIFAQVQHTNIGVWVCFPAQNRPTLWFWHFRTFFGVSHTRSISRVNPVRISSVEPFLCWARGGDGKGMRDAYAVD